MLKEFAEYIRNLKGFETTEINGETYSDKPLVKVEPPEYHTEEVALCSLDGLIQMAVDVTPLYKKVYIHVVSPTEVEVFSDLDGHKKRDKICRVKLGGPEFLERPLELPEAVMQLRALCKQSEDRDYLISALSDVAVVHEEDYRRTGKAAETSVIITVGNDTLKKELKLKPARTFPEVEQPESLFILSVEEQEWIEFAPVFQGLFSLQQQNPTSVTKRGIRATLVCADGGAWRRTAMERVREYLRKEADGYCCDGEIIVV